MRKPCRPRPTFNGMRVLNLSLDNKVLENDSAVQRRLVALADKAGEITVLVPGEKDEKQELSSNLTVYSFDGARPIQLWKMWRKGEKLLTCNSSLLTSTDLITVQDTAYLAFLAYLLARRFNLPLEVQVHGLEKFYGIRKIIAEFALNRADKIRVVSERLRQLLASRFQFLGSKVYVLSVYTQIEVSQKTARRKTVPYPFTFLTVGRLVAVKNIGMQIRAFAKISEKIPHISLRIVGEGPERSNLQLSISNYQLEDKVTLEGYQRDLHWFYEESDAFLLTSDSEGWGRVVLEAAAHKLPIIMTDVGLAREVIKNEESGFVIPVGDEHELMLAMKEFLDKPELRARLGEAAFRVFKSLPSKEEQTQKQVEVWQSLLPN